MTAARAGQPTGEPSAEPAPPLARPVPRVRPRRSLSSVLLVLAVIVVLSLLLGALGDLSWPWDSGTLNGAPAPVGSAGVSSTSPSSAL